MNKNTMHIMLLAKKLVHRLFEHSTWHQILCWADSLMLLNPPLRQAPKPLFKQLNF